MKLDKLCDSLGLDLPANANKIDINEIKTNSKNVCTGDLFICIKGLSTDGHDYVWEAEKNGASVIICEREIMSNLPTILCKNARSLLPRLYGAWYSHPEKKLKIIGVTGTNGKTTITHLLEKIFSSHSTGVIGTIESRINGKEIIQRKKDGRENMTTPDPDELFKTLSYMSERGVEYVFMEVSSHALALHKLDGIEFECGIFTNLTEEHLDFHADMEDYFMAKSKLFNVSRIKIINIDDEYGARLFEKYGNAVSCSMKKDFADHTIRELRNFFAEGSELELVSKNGRFKIKSRLIGDYNKMNILEAAACALSMGISNSEISRAIASIEGIKGRLERVKLDFSKDFSVFIDYAHTPDAFKNLLSTVRGVMKKGERLVLVFGCGGDRDRGKRKKMGEIASKLADFTVVTSDNSRSEDPMAIISEIISGMNGGDFIVIENRREAIEYAIKEAKSGDFIILAGKGHEEYEITKDGRKPFSEAVIVREIIDKNK